MFQPFNIDAKINAAWVVMGLLYGDGDFTRTYEIATRCGDDADCNPGTAGGVLASIVGFKNIPDFWKPTIRLLNMPRVPATLRSYDIATIYVMQDKIQNDMMYGDKASKAILSNLSYQFFGKVNDPDTVKYYERFFEIVKKETTSVNRGQNLDFDTRITTGEKEI